jgi:uncharacterized protein with HEPN domain
MINLTFCNLQGFKDLETDKEQFKELFFLYGLCFARIATVDAFFINQLTINKYVFEGEQVGRTYTDEEKEKFAKHHNDVATTKMLVNAFREKFDTAKFDDLFDELVKIRNLLAHKYMRHNWLDLQNRELREEIYDDLFYVFDFLNEFDEKMSYQQFATRANSAYVVRWKGGRKSD